MSLTIKNKIIILVVTCLGFCLAEFLIIHKYSPVPTSSREVVVTELLQQFPLKDGDELISAESFCSAWAGGRPVAELDCRSGRDLKLFSNASQGNAKEILQITVNQIKTRLDRLASIRAKLGDATNNTSELAQILDALDAKILRARQKLTELSSLGDTQLIQDSPGNYKIVFELLLDLEGQVYQSLKGSFRNKPWDIAQIVQHKDELVERGNQLKQSLSLLPKIIICASLILLLLAFWRMGWTGLCFMAIYLSFCLLGLLITADASVHFGENSSYFPFNPLGDQLHRQIAVISLAYGLLALILVSKSFANGLLRMAMRHPFATTWFIVAVVFSAYSTLSPAIGSEALQLGTALLAGINLTDQGRVLHLTHKYAPEVFKISSIKLLLRNSSVDPSNPLHRVVLHIAKPLLNFCAFSLLTLGACTLIFNDLGGALISMLMMITALFLAFGSKPTWVVLLIGAVSATTLSFTDKLQVRIDLMLAPMSASISDFARLLAYSEASKPLGFGLGQLRWCNQEGTCLPIQVLSDYMPTVLNGIAGPYGTLILFMGLAIFFIVIAGISCWRFMAQQGIARLASVVTFFFLLASIIQTLLTFLGNWRLIPLTGVGAPLLSIGFSSILAPTLAMGLFLISTSPLKEGARD